MTGAIPTWTLGDRLRKARLHAGLDQAQLAAITGMSRNTVGNYEADKSTPSKLYLRAWATATGVSIEWLQHGDDAPS